MQTNKDTTILILDPSPTDRQLIRSALKGKADRFIEVEDAADAWKAMRGINNLILMVANVDAATGEDIFDLRDHLQKERDVFPVVFCSAEDMSPFYSRIFDQERAFLKPVNFDVLLEWFARIRGEAPLASEPAENTVPSEEAPVRPPDSGVIQEQLPSKSTAPVTLPDDVLPMGTRLGDYKLLREIQVEADFALYEAEQISIGRHVALKALYRKHRKEYSWVEGFVHEASARASVNHPAISLVYECNQELGVNFYALELVDAPSLADLAHRRADLSDATIWKILDSVSSALAYLRDQNLSHRLVTARSILVVKGTEPRIANPVKDQGEALTPEEERRQIEILADAVLPFLSKPGVDPLLFALVDRMGTDRIDAVNSINALRKALVPPERRENREARRPSQRPQSRPQKAKPTSKATMVMGGVIGILIIIAAVTMLLFMGSKPVARDLEAFIRVPAGKFIFQAGEQAELPEFWISHYEVTIAEYANFLIDLGNHPSFREKIRHPDQPANKLDYTPEKWSQYYDAATRGKTFRGGKIDVNCPVTGIDFWDAHAYAAWRGGRLPTEQEWEKASRGRDGNIYPWGNDLVEGNFNSGIDHDGKDGVAAGSIDGYRYWNPVDAIAMDESPYGVVGCAGNVSEWTASWVPHPDTPERKVPLKRGASFVTTSGFELTARKAAESAEERNLFTGFRIVADSEHPVKMSDRTLSVPPAVATPAPVAPPAPAPSNPAAPVDPMGATPAPPAPSNPAAPVSDPMGATPAPPAPSNPPAPAQ